MHHALPELAPSIAWDESARASRSPISLSTSDGQDLRLVSLRANVTLADPVAFTELRFVFHNPQQRRREGTFEIALPNTAVPARVAMKVAGIWQEGEVVERSRGRAVYDDYLHERPTVDPLLLEHESGQRFSARVFPILPGERKEIVIAYTQTLDRSHYRLPLQGLGKMDSLDVKVRVTDGKPLELSKKDFAPKGDLTVRTTGHDRTAAAAVAGDLVVARIRVPESVEPDPVAGLSILVDTSASSAGQSEHLERLAATLEALPHPAEVPIQVVGFDQAAAVVFRGTAAQFRVGALPRIVARGTMGATDLAGAFEFLASSEPFSRVLLVGDGLATVGPATSGDLRASLEKLAQSGVLRMDAFVDEDQADRALLAALVTSDALLHSGVVIDAEAAPFTVVQTLGRSSLSDTKIHIEGASFSWPRDLSGYNPGDDVVVVGQLRAPSPTAVDVRFSEPRLPTQRIEAVTMQRPLLERQVVAGRIARLRSAMHETGRSSARAQMHRRQIVALSTRYRVVTEETAFLVLESDAERRRYGLLREDLPDILATVDGELQVLERSAASDDDPGAFFDLWWPRLSAPNAEDEHMLASPYGGSFAFGENKDDWGGLDGIRSAADLDRIMSSGILGAPRTVGGLGLTVGGAQLDGTIGGGPGGLGNRIGLGNSGIIGAGPMGNMPTFDGGIATRLLRNPLQRPESDSGLTTPTSAVAMSVSKPVSKRGPARWRSRAQVGSRSTFFVRAAPTILEHRGPIDPDLLRRITRARGNEIGTCARRTDAHLAGRSLQFEFEIAGTGHISALRPGDDERNGNPLLECVAQAHKRWHFPESSGTTKVRVGWNFTFESRGPRKPSRPGRAHDRSPRGKIDRLLAAGDPAAALEAAWRWHADAPADVFALLTLGDTARAAGDTTLAQRAYGSIIDLWPSRAPFRRMAGERLEALDLASARALAKDSFDKSVRDRPDQIAGHRLRAIAALRLRDYRAAFDALIEGLAVAERTGSDFGTWSRFRGARSLLLADLGMVASAWAVHEQDRRAEIERKLATLGLSLDTTPSARVVLHWENDATDIDLHLQRVDEDGRRHPLQPFFDVHDGYGPEFWLSQDPLPSKLRVWAHEYDRGPMGPTAGVLHVIVHDGKGKIHIEERPFTMMQNNALVDFGEISLPS